MIIYVLRKNGEDWAESEEASEIQSLLEDYVVTWNKESSGWDGNGNFWTITTIDLKE